MEKNFLRRISSNKTVIDATFDAGFSHAILNPVWKLKNLKIGHLKYRFLTILVIKNLVEFFSRFGRR